MIARLVDDNFPEHEFASMAASGHKVRSAAITAPVCFMSS